MSVWTETFGGCGGEEHKIPFEAKAAAAAADAAAKKSETHFSLFSSLSLCAALFSHSALLLSPGKFLLWPFSLSLPFLPLRLVSRRMLHNVSGVEEKFMDANFM